MRAEDRIVAITCICLANRLPRSWFNGKERIIIQKGQFVRSWAQLSREAGLNLQVVRTSVKNLCNVEFLTRVPTGSCHLFTIPKYEHYQDLTKYSDSIASQSNRVPNSPLTGTQQAPNSELTTNNNLISKEWKKEEIAADAAPARLLAKAVVDLWNAGKDSKDWIRVTPKRVAKVQARLNEGMTEQDIRAAVANILKSEFHQGVNDRGWRAPGPEWVLQSAEKAEEWKSKPNNTFAERRDASGPRKI